MSQNLRNQPGEGQGNSGRGDEHQERKRFEGFEGMNYEQRRQPFNPQHTTSSRNQDDDSTGRKSNEE